LKKKHVKTKKRKKNKMWGKIKKEKKKENNLEEEKKKKNKKQLWRILSSHVLIIFFNTYNIFNISNATLSLFMF